MTGIRWALCLAAASHALGLGGGPLEDYGQRRLVLFLAKSLEVS